MNPASRKESVYAQSSWKASMSSLPESGMEESGGQRRNRTADASLFRAALYQLSYLATWVFPPFTEVIGIRAGMLKATPNATCEARRHGRASECCRILKL